MYVGVIKEGNKATSTRSKEAVCRDFQLCSNGESWSAEEVYDKGTNIAILGERNKGLVDIRFVEA